MKLLDGSAALAARRLADGTIRVVGRDEEANELTKLFVATLASDGAVLAHAPQPDDLVGDRDAFAAVIDPAGDAYVLSRVGAEGQGLVSKLAPDGTVLWEQAVPDPGLLEPSARGIALDPTGGVVVVGTYLTTSGDAFVTKLAGDGAVAWTRAFDGGWVENAEVVTVDGEGNVHVVGVFEESADRYQLAKLAPGGEVVQVRTIGPQFLTPYAIEVGPDGAAHVIGSDGPYGGWVGRFAPDGAEVWTRHLGELGAHSLLLAGGEVRVGRGIRSATGTDGVVDAFEPATGAPLWQTIFDLAPVEEDRFITFVLDLAPAPDGSTFALGAVREYLPGGGGAYEERAYVAKLDPEGNLR